MTIHHRLQPKNRPELVERMRVKGLTQQEIADTAGVSRPTIAADLLNADSDIEPITNSRGQQRVSRDLNTHMSNEVPPITNSRNLSAILLVNRKHFRFTPPAARHQLSRSSTTDHLADTTAILNRYLTIHHRL